MTNRTAENGSPVDGKMDLKVFDIDEPIFHGRHLVLLPLVVEKATDDMTGSNVRFHWRKDLTQPGLELGTPGVKRAAARAL